MAWCSGRNISLAAVRSEWRTPPACVHILNVARAPCRRSPRKERYINAQHGRQLAGMAGKVVVYEAARSGGWGWDHDLNQPRHRPGHRQFSGARSQRVRR